jgi:hypothetical protein
LTYITALNELKKSFKIDKLTFFAEMIFNYLKENKITIINLLFFDSWRELNLTKYYSKLKTVELQIIEKCKKEITDKIKEKVKEKVIKEVKKVTTVFNNLYHASKKDRILIETLRSTQKDEDAKQYQYLIMSLTTAPDAGSFHDYKVDNWRESYVLVQRKSITEFIQTMSQNRLYKIYFQSSASYTGGEVKKESLYQPSFLSYYIYITLELYPGKVDVNKVKKPFLQCDTTRENIKQSIANIRHLPYEPPTTTIKELKSLDPNYPIKKVDEKKLKDKIKEKVDTIKGGQIPVPFEIIYLH